MAEVVIFGTMETAETAYFYLKNDTNHKVVAFTVSKKYLKENKINGLPVVPFEEIETLFPPNKYKLFAPLTGKHMNTLREKVYHSGKSLGYEFITYISSKTLNFSSSIGENCFILENNIIRPSVKMGNNVVVWNGNHIGQFTEINDHVFITSHVVIGGRCKIESNCYFGLNSTVKEFSILSKGTLLGMGAVFVDKKTDSWSIYKGNPAKKDKNKKSL